MSATTDPDRGPADHDELVALGHLCFDWAREGRTDRLAAYVDTGVPADLTDPDGNTLLMLAAYHGHGDTVAALVNRGASPDRANDRGQTPLAGAVFKGEDAVVEALLTAGADPDAGTPSARDTARMFGQEHLLDRCAQGGDQ